MNSNNSERVFSFLKILYFSEKVATEELAYVLIGAV